MTTILVVDDDLALADVIAFALRRSGYEVLLAHDGVAACELYAKQRPDLVVLDWNLPSMSGIEVGKHMRAEFGAAIIMLTVRDHEKDIIMALESCADDYVTKPFSPHQLVARIRAVLRRANIDKDQILKVGNMTIDPTRRQAQLGDSPPISLTQLEARLLLAFVGNPNVVLPAESLITRVWGSAGGTREMLKQLIYRLRKKIESDPKSPVLIETVSGFGYVLNAPSETR